MKYHLKVPLDGGQRARLERYAAIAGGTEKALQKILAFGLVAADLAFQAYHDGRGGEAEPRKLAEAKAAKSLEKFQAIESELVCVVADCEKAKATALVASSALKMAREDHAAAAEQAVRVPALEAEIKALSLEMAESEKARAAEPELELVGLPPVADDVEKQLQDELGLEGEPVDPVE